ncbi:hypothetical protein SDC9_155312 [bioreactor metagenome]|uniref:Uncharacterized protein n=1 Tax=bioreactor metagenome TaxID=1076179 RepID=A0A645F343_9ZZZZ
MPGNSDSIRCQPQSLTEILSHRQSARFGQPLVVAKQLGGPSRQPLTIGMTDHLETNPLLPPQHTRECIQGLYRRDGQIRLT